MRPWSRRRAPNRALVLAASLVVPACASTARHEASTVPASDHDSARVAELESRVRQLETELETSRARSTGTTAIRIGSDAEPLDSEPPEGAGATDETTPGDESPVVLRLHEDHPDTPIPIVTERLAVAPMPAPPFVAPPPPLPVQTVGASPSVSAAAPTPLAAILPSAGAPPATVVPVTATPTETDDSTAYRQGLGHLTARRFEAAITSLSTFLRDHPGSARADDALYWRATAHYALRHYGEALVDYERVPRIAPRGEHAADAIFHAGLCHRRLGAEADARSAFARVRRDYPDSVAARLAAREEST